MTSPKNDKLEAEMQPISVKTWLCGAVTGSTALMAMVDSTFVNLGLNSITKDLEADLSSSQWIVSAYLIAMAVSLPMIGWLGAVFGYGRVWAVSTFLFTITSGLCAFSPSLNHLIVGRIFQGLAAGLMVPAGQAVLASQAGPRQLGRLMGILGLVISLGPAIGPAFGGILLDYASWPWLFFVNIPIGMAAIIVAQKIVPLGKLVESRPLDLKGFFLLCFGVPSILIGGAGIAENEQKFWCYVIVLFGIFCTIAYVQVSKKNANPLLDIRLFRNRIFSSASLLIVFTGANMYGLLLLLPLYYLQFESIGTAAIGLLLLVLGLGSSVVLPFAGWATDRFGGSKICLAGSLIMVATAIPFFLLDHLSQIAILTNLFVRGVGLALAQMPAITLAYSVTGNTKLGDASGIINVAQRIGGAVGAIIIAILVNSSNEPLSSDLYYPAFLGILGMSVLSIGPAWLLSVHKQQG